MKSPSCIAIVLFALICAVKMAQPQAQTHKRQFEFEQFPAEIYKGPLHIPDDLHKDEQGDWRDYNDKWVAPPGVTFAGEYYLAARSCGAGCRYYELTSLRTGEAIPEISMFDSGEPLPKTRDGHSYLTILYYKPESRLLIAEYYLDFDGPNNTETCRQRYFVLENGKINPISKTLFFCTEDNKARQ
jgi:hypothetical protein